MSYVSSWSGGKDGCFACYKAICQGYDMSHLVNFISQEYKRVRFHGTEAGLIQLQAKAIGLPADCQVGLPADCLVGLPLVQKETTPDGYERQFKEAIGSLIPAGIEGVVFGDIYLQEHKDWVERICGDLGIQAIEPLWGRDPEELLQEFVDAGFQAVIVAANAEFFDADWIGRKVDKDFLKYLQGKNIDPCGENGEYHTLVTGGPLFKKAITITRSKTVRKNGYWFLDTLEYRL